MAGKATNGTMQHNLNVQVGGLKTGTTSTYQDHQSNCEFVYSFSARKKRGIMKRPVRKYLAECKTRVALDQLNCMLQKKIFWE
jgi:hypothetical protein